MQELPRIKPNFPFKYTKDFNKTTHVTPYWPIVFIKNNPVKGWSGLSKNVQKMSRKKVKTYLIFNDLTWSQPSTHPPNHTPTHRWHSWRSLHCKCPIFKQNWNILICFRLIEILLIWGSPLGVGLGWVGTHTCMLNMINMDASMEVAICNFYTCIF